MCGIAGLYYRDGRNVDAGRLERMTAVLAHRGPDGHGLWHEHNIGLGHRRLSIRDLSEAGHQPLADPSGRIVVSYNGEIYNDAALRAELEREYGARFNSTCDTEIIPAGYLAWGEGLFGRLEGMFAIALWDRQEKTLVLARDGIGIKPLYYSASAPAVRFGSEIKALLADGEQARQISAQDLHRFLAMGYAGPTRTTLDGIGQVAPGSIISFTAQGQRETRFWTPARTSHIRSLDEAVEAFRPLWATVVRDHLVSDVPLGILQSGGIDSTLVAIEAGRNRKQDLFTARFSEATYDESSAAAVVAHWLGAPLHALMVDTDHAIPEVLEQIVHHYDGQICDEASIPLYLLCREVRRHVTVALTGDGGDETFGGYPTYRASRFAAGLAPLLSGALMGAMGRFSYGLGGSNEKRLPLSALVSRLLLGIGRDPRHAHAQWRRLVPEFMLGELYGPQMQALLGDDPIADYKRALDTAGGSVLDRCLLADQRFHLPGGLLVKSDVMSMAHSLELRVPFLDRRIVDFAGSCDGALLTGLTGKTKIILRSAAQQLGVPASVATAPKHGFNAPLARLMRTSLRALCEGVFEKEPDIVAPYLDAGAVRKLWRQHRDLEVNHAYALWPILNFAIWRRGLDRTNTAAANTPLNPTPLGLSQ